MPSDHLTGDLLREVAQVQRTKTLLEVRDMVDSLRTKGQDRFGGYNGDRVYADEFKQALLAKLRDMGANHV